MRLLFLIYISAANFSTSTSSATGSDSLSIITEESMLNFISGVENKSSRTLEFYYENGSDEKGQKTVSGLVYYISDTLYMKLFYSWKFEDATILTFDPLPISVKSNRKKIKNILEKINGYDKVKCYETHQRKNMSSEDYPEVSTEFYWHYKLKYKKKDRYTYVTRDKLSLKDMGCNTRKNKLMERKDFDEIRELLNLTLLDNKYPILN